MEIFWVLIFFVVVAVVINFLIRRSYGRERDALGTLKDIIQESRPAKKNDGNRDGEDS